MFTISLGLLIGTYFLKKQRVVENNGNILEQFTSTVSKPSEDKNILEAYSQYSNDKEASEFLKRYQKVLNSEPLDTLALKKIQIELKYYIDNYEKY